MPRVKKPLTPPVGEIDPLPTPKQTAALLGIAAGTPRDWRTTGNGPAGLIVKDAYRPTTPRSRSGRQY